MLAWIAPYVSEVLPGIGRDTIRDGIIGDLLLIAGFLVLGGGFWEKLGALFSRTAFAALPRQGNGTLVASCCFGGSGEYRGGRDVAVA